MEQLGNTPIRTCKSCGWEAYSEQILPLSFVASKGSKYGYRNLCQLCKIKENKANPKQKDWKTNHQTQKRYGVDVETYKQRMQSSDSCEICGTKDQLCYDHDHDTMEFRGVLCRSCNRSIGQLGDTLAGVLKVVDYLRKERNDK